MAARTLSSRRKAVGITLNNIEEIIDKNNLRGEKAALVAYTYLYAMIMNKTTNDVVYQIALMRMGGTAQNAINELRSFAQGK
jgi:hypothetical protein